MKKGYYYTIILSTVLLATSCTLYQKPVVPALQVPDHFKEEFHVTHPSLNEKWWENFHDLRLNTLVELALKNNLDYKVALKNIEIMNTYVVQYFSALFPQVNAYFDTTDNKSAAANLAAFASNSVLNASDQNQSRKYKLSHLYGTVSYEIDVWNQIHNQVAQAKENTEMSIAQANIIKLSLITTVVDTYFKITTANAAIANLHRQLAVAIEFLQLQKTQLQSGLVDASSVEQASNQVEAIKASIPVQEKQKSILLHSLAYLVGEYPEKWTFPVNQSIVALKTNHLIPEGIPSSMLANRPDIQNAFHQILSYGYLEKQNIANFLPALSLTGTYGYASNSLAHLISAANTYWTYGFYVAQFVFDYQLRMSQYKRSQYQYESAILTYRATVLNAYTEVDNALISFEEDHKTLLANQQQMFHMKALTKLAEAQYQAGLNDYTAYLSADLAYLQSELTTANQKLMVVEDTLQIYKALGLYPRDFSKPSR